MNKFRIMILGGLFVLFSFVMQCSCVKAADSPRYQVTNKTWDSITISVSFSSNSNYNRLSLSSPYDYSESIESNVMYSKGTYTYTFTGLKNPGSLYYITLYYGENQFIYFSTRTIGIPQGKHVSIDLDFVKYIKGNITYNNLARWIEHLDDAYDSYYNLVGAKPDNGEIIKIESSDEDYGYMWVYPDTSTIYWNEDYIASGLRQIGNEDDWHFGALHEMGHLFDLDDIWTFDSEFFANFKMAYVFYEHDGNFRVKIGDTILTKYSEIVNYYYKKSSKAYTKTIGANPMRYSNDGLTYMFLNAIDKFGSWDCISNTFGYYIAMGKQGDSSETIDSFLGTANYFSRMSNPFSVAFSNYYGDRCEYVIQYINNHNL